MPLRQAIPICVHVLSCVQLFGTPQTVAHQAPLSMGFPRQEHWSVSPSPSPRDLPDPGTKLASPAPPALSGGFFTSELPGEACLDIKGMIPGERKMVNFFLKFTVEQNSRSFSPYCIFPSFAQQSYRKKVLPFYCTSWPFPQGKGELARMLWELTWPPLLSYHYE